MQIVIGFELAWGRIAECRTKPLAVVKYLYVFDDCLFCKVSGLQRISVKPFNFHGVKEGLCACFIQTLCFSAHAAADIIVSQKLLIFMTAVLTSSIWMTNESDFIRTSSDHPTICRLNQSKTTARSIQPCVVNNS